MAYRKRHRGTTAQRGYGNDHVKLRKQLLAAWKPGDPCARCGQPIWQLQAYDARGRLISAIHLGHTDDRTGYTGLEHSTCNEADGARRRNRMYSARLAKGWASARRW